MAETHRFSQRLAENRRWMVASSRSEPLARYPLIICPMAVVRSGKFHSSARTCTLAPYALVPAFVPALQHAGELHGFQMRLINQGRGHACPIPARGWGRGWGHTERAPNAPKW